MISLKTYNLWADWLRAWGVVGIVIGHDMMLFRPWGKVVDTLDYP